MVDLSYPLRDLSIYLNTFIRMHLSGFVVMDSMNTACNMLIGENLPKITIFIERKIYSSHALIN